MTTEEAIKHFGSTKKLAIALEVWPQVIYNWGERPPKAKQFEIHVLSGGVLKIDNSFPDRKPKAAALAATK